MDSAVALAVLAVLVATSNVLGDRIDGISTLDTPYGLHLAFGNGGVQQGRVRCLWATARRLRDQNGTSAVCQYGPSASDLQWTSIGHSYTYTAGNFTGSLHEVSLSQMPTAPGTQVYYRCGNPATLSSVHNFTVQDPNVVDSFEKFDVDQPWIGVICDMGIKKSENTIASLSKAVQTGVVQAVVHGGDISYANDYKPAGSNAYVWQTYFDSVSQFASYVPYMTCPGNHESQFDFAGYNNWLPMPNASGSSFYHSFDYMGVHFTMFSTEHNFSNGSAQHSWIVTDLRQANGNREKVPWIVVVGHRPLYCSDLVLLKRCTEEAPVFRSYVEAVFNEYKVDVYINGHNHQYERSYPMVNGKATQKDYVNPKAPVYIVDGAAGNTESIDPTFLPEALAPWRAHHSDWLGTSWLRMRAGQQSLQLQLINSETDKVSDEFEIQRTAD